MTRTETLKKKQTKQTNPIFIIGNAKQKTTKIKPNQKEINMRLKNNSPSDLCIIKPNKQSENNLMQKKREYKVIDIANMNMAFP